MTTPTEHHVRRTIESYGKIGVIIDDNDDAEAIVALAFYGSSFLPDWWVIAPTFESAEVVLSTLVAYEADGGRSVRKLLVIDRMLPPRRSSRDPERDDGEGKRFHAIDKDPDLCRFLVRLGFSPQPLDGLHEFLVKQLREERYTVAVFTTSYPVDNDVVHTGFPWCVGAQEPLRLLRIEIARLSCRHGWRDMLRFGPSCPPKGLGACATGSVPEQTSHKLELYLGRLRRFPPPSAALHRPVDDALVKSVYALASSYLEENPNDAWSVEKSIQDGTRRSMWFTTIQLLASSMNEGSDMFVLLTGAGMSMSARPTGAGLPLNQVLLADAAWWVLNGHVADASGLRRPSWRSGKLGDDLAHGYDGEWLSSADELLADDKSDPFSCTLRAFRQQDPKQYPTGDFNRLFQLGNQGAVEARTNFRAGIRLATSEFDRGIPLQHWLAARRKWNLIVTTNYDSFHERGAILAANRETEIARARAILSSGVRDPRREGQWGSSMGGASVDLGPRLLKIYGSILDAEGLAFDRSDFRARVNALNGALGKLLDARLVRGGTFWLVAVGFKMADDQFAAALDQAFRKCRESGFARVRVLWVIIESMPHYLECRDTQECQDPAVAAWHAAFHDYWVDTSPGFEFEFIALSGKAIDFFYDLEVACQEIAYDKSLDRRSRRR